MANIPGTPDQASPTPAPGQGQGGIPHPGDAPEPGRREEERKQQERQTGGRQAEKYWKSFMGVAVWTDPKLDLISPIKHVAQVEAPVLLIHGKDDSVVLYDQSVRMADALRKGGSKVQLNAFEGKGMQGHADINRKLGDPSYPATPVSMRG